MFCPKCGKINPDNNELCSGCNAPLREETENKPSKKNANWGKILLAVAIVVVAAVVVVLALSGCGAGTLPEENISF